MRHFSLRLRLALVMLFAFFLGLGGSSLFYWAEIHELQDDLLGSALHRQAGITTEAIQGDAVAVDRLPPDWATAYREPDSLLHFVLYAADGSVLDHSPNLPAGLPSPLGVPFGQVRRVDVGQEKAGLVVVAAGDGRILQVARADISSPGLVEELTEEAVEFLFYTMLPFALMSMTAIWLVAGWSLRPVLRASRAAALVSPEAPDARIPTRGLPSEVLPLVDAANGALQRLTTAYGAVRRLTADAAHELRTPLAALTLRLQRVQAGGAADWPAIERELGHLRRLVQQMLALARRESPGQAVAEGWAPLNLSRIAREVAASLLPLAEAEGRTIEVDAPVPAPVDGVADELRDMLRNLVENALGHGAGRIVVAVALARDGRVDLVVSDEGRGIPPELGEAAFERFRKGDAASAGAGLGLAIVRRVVERHRGSITVEDGPGCRIRVSLAAAAG
ncbi:sensor histidine kinase [Geminicoccus roseus]|uniref:sensor histidine kinase n=1 Tax=Geminicoccus roseus TaxID=404900 RepID=UPI0003FF07CE|nr:HAMP domain-containing sensor histidine kinase [Geminicoccus roseus]